MNKSYKAASSVGTVALVLSGSLMAAVPTFDKWTVTNGGINAGACDTGFTCGSALSDVGFFQRMVTEDSSGNVFFQTIITENTASASSAAALDALAFSDESFVRTGNVNGISDKQRISESRNNNGSNTSAGVTTFRASTTLASGWAGNSLKLTQHLDDSADTFQTDFLFRQEGDSAASAVTAKGMKITAYVPISGTDKQDFVLVDLSGDFARFGSGSVTLPSGTMTWTKDTQKGSGGTVGDEIKAVYVGQDLTNIVGQVFGFTSYDNLTTGANDFISTFSLTSVSPVAWDTAVWGDTVTQGASISDPFIPWP